MEEAYLDYFYADESQQFRFLMIPMELYDNHAYDVLDGAAPAVYAAMLFRISDSSFFPGTISLPA